LTDFGCLIAGGRARRLGGRAKGLLRYRGRPLIDRLADLLRARCTSVMIIGDPEGPYVGQGLPVTPDLVDAGPPGGVLTGLTLAREQGASWVWTLACDLPRVDAETLDGLAAVRDGHQAALYRAAGRIQPLAACWHVSALPIFEQALRDAQPGFRTLVGLVDAVVVDAPHPDRLTNLNTPADCAALGIDIDGIRSGPER